MFSQLNQLSGRYKNLMEKTVYNQGEVYSLASLKTRGTLSYGEVVDLIVIGQYVDSLNKLINEHTQLDILDDDLIARKPVTYLDEEYSIDKLAADTFKSISLPTSSPNPELLYVLIKLFDSCTIVSKRKLMQSRYFDIIEDIISSTYKLPKIYGVYSDDNVEMITIGHRFILIGHIGLNRNAELVCIDCFGLLSRYLSFDRLSNVGKVFPHFTPLDLNGVTQYRDNIPYCNANRLDYVRADSTFLFKGRISNDQNQLVTLTKLRSVLSNFGLDTLCPKPKNISGV